MTRMSGNRWLGILVAVLAIGGLGLYASTAASHPAAPAGTSAATAMPSGSGITAPSSESSIAVPATSAVPGMSAATIVGLLIKIGIVAALLGLSLWLLRRYAGTSSRSGGRTGAISIVDTIPLAQGRAMYVLDIGDRAILIGATPQQFSLLGDVTDEAVLARLRGARDRSHPSIGAVALQFGGLMQRIAAKPDASTAPPRERRSRSRIQPAAQRPERQASPSQEPPQYAPQTGIAAQRRAAALRPERVITETALERPRPSIRANAGESLRAQEGAL